MISSSPAAEVIDFTEAERLYYEGEFEGALDIYSAAVERGTYEERRQGLWRIANIQSQLGEHSDAESNLEVLRQETLDTATNRRSLLLLGSVEFAQGDMIEAREAFDAYVLTNGPATPYAWLYLAQIEAAEENGEAATADIEMAIEAGLPGGVQSEALFALADHYEDAGDMTNAAATYQRIAAEASTSADAAEALWRLGQVEAGVGNTASAQTAYRRLIKGYPAFGRALDAINTEEAAADSGVTTFDRAYTQFLQRNNGVASESFHFILDNPATGIVEAAQAHYYLGILSERSSLYDDALVHYDASINGLNPGVAEELRGQAMWDKATVLELLGRTDEAIAAYAAVGDVPSAERAGEATFRAGFLAYSLGRPGEATTYWTRFQQVAPNSEERARAHYWLAKAMDASALPGAADEYAAAATTYPEDYYGLRARALLNGLTGFGVNIPDDLPPPDWLAVEAWLEGFAGPENPVARNRLLDGEAWSRGLELLAAGLPNRADDEFTTVMDDASSKPWALYRIARKLDAMGISWISTLAAQRLSFQAPGAPPALYRLVYPLAYIDLVRAEAEANGFDPLLQLAMIRQESLYQPDGVSIADARGLTQVIPNTADFLAEELAIDDFVYADLFRPHVSIRFGAYYIGNLIDDAEGDFWVAVAGYNGGPGNASAWAEGTGGDPDLFLESVTFSETRAYVEIVLENWALYRYAWGVDATPALPLN
ncbi:MAG TPA: tetratricopeptide repeat protein [Dehalococcoidia bacterium]|nr:tetratricopeptide repeat protein [Dehalococcoidia bacterium]